MPGVVAMISSPMVAETAPSATAGLNAPVGSSRWAVRPSSRSIATTSSTATAMPASAGSAAPATPPALTATAAAASRPSRSPGKPRTIPPGACAGSTRWATSAKPRPISRSTPKAQRQAFHCANTPPTAGPSSAAAPHTVPSRLIARACRAGGNTTRIVA